MRCARLLIFGLFVNLTLMPTAEPEEWDEYSKPVELLTVENEGIHRIDYFDTMDQCMPAPDHTNVFHNRLAFFLMPHQFCGGNGALICFQGQLGVEQMLPNGISPDVPWRLRNVKGNPVTVQCDQLREQLEREKCQPEKEQKKKQGKGNGKEEGEESDDDNVCPWKTPWQKPMGHGTWHGMLVRTDEADRVQIQLSTTNTKFTIERNKFNNWLILKIASGDLGMSSFLSKHFGPRSNFHDPAQTSAYWTEMRNKIAVEEDELLQQSFDVEAGSYIRHHAGIWTLGLDILPQMGTDTFWLFTRRDNEFCDLQAWFLRQNTDGHPTPNKTKIDQLRVLPESFKEREIRLFKGIMVPLLGSWRACHTHYIPIGGYLGKSAFQGMRMNVTLGGEAKFELKHNDTWTDSGQPMHNFFQRGKFFKAKIRIFEKQIEVNMNCLGARNLSLNGYNIFFANLHLITISGDVTMYDGGMPSKPTSGGVGSASLNSWKYPDATGSNFKPKVGNGILLTGQIMESNHFTLNLFQLTAGHIYERYLSLRVGIMEQEYQIFEYNDEVMWTGKHNYTRGSWFELFVLLKKKYQNNLNGEIEVFGLWANNTWLTDFVVDLPPDEIDYIQILGDVKLSEPTMLSGEHKPNISNKTTAMLGPFISPKIPLEFRFNYKKFGTLVWTAKGRVLNTTDKNFQCEFAFHHVPVDKKKKPVDMQIIANETGMHIMNIKMGDDEPYLNNWFHLGADFVIEMRTLKRDGNFKVEIRAKTTHNDTLTLDYIEFEKVTISGDLFLYGQPYYE